jgi:galactokinase
MPHRSVSHRRSPRPLGNGQGLSLAAADPDRYPLLSRQDALVLEVAPPGRTRSFFAPGRVNLIGEHTDYTGGLVLPAALALGVRIDATPDDRIRLSSDGFGEIDLDARGRENVTEGWGRYAAAVASELDALGRPPAGLRGQVRSTVPAGAGLSSSAALEVALAIALAAIARFELDPLDLVLATQRAEARAVGVPCGVMDQAAAAFGRAGHALLLDTASLDRRWVRMPSELAIVVVDSGVRRRLEDSRYATRRRELEQAIDADRRTAVLEPMLARRLRHVVTENERVRRTAEILESPSPDMAALGTLFRESHASLRDDFEVSTPELDALVERAYAEGAVAARLTGAGFGGSAVVLAHRDGADALSERLGRARVLRTGDGAREL